MWCAPSEVKKLLENWPKSKISRVTLGSENQNIAFFTYDEVWLHFYTPCGLNSMCAGDLQSNTQCISLKENVLEPLKFKTVSE